MLKDGPTFLWRIPNFPWQVSRPDTFPLYIACFHLLTVSMNRSLIHTGSLGGRAEAELSSILATTSQGPGSVSQVSNPTSNSLMVVTAATCWRPAPRPIAARSVTVAVAVGWPPVN